MKLDIRSGGVCWLKFNKHWSVGILSTKHKVNKKKGFCTQIGSNKGVKIWKGYFLTIPFIMFAINYNY